MSDERGTWKVFGERTVYDNRWVRLSLVALEAPNGERGEHHVVHLDRVAIAMLVNERDDVLMLHRYRFAVDQWGYELLGGLAEEGEESAVTAKREAEEESGWRPLGEPIQLASFEPMPGMVTARTDVFMWRGAEHVGEPTDTEEAGRLEWVPGEVLIRVSPSSGRVTATGYEQQFRQPARRTCPGWRRPTWSAWDTRRCGSRARAKRASPSWSGCLRARNRFPLPLSGRLPGRVGRAWKAG